jgi:cytochrome P450
MLLDFDEHRHCRAESLALDKPAVSFADLDAMRSVDPAMRESLRLVAPPAQIGRRAIKDTELLGYHVPKGFYVVPMLYSSHPMPEYWSRPEAFDPERFAEGRREDKSHRYARAPFGGGVHKCMGMHFAFIMVKAVMHQMLQRFSWSVDPGYEVPWNYKGMPVQLRSRR